MNRLAIAAVAALWAFPACADTLLSKAEAVIGKVADVVGEVPEYSEDGLCVRPDSCRASFSDYDVTVHGQGVVEVVRFSGTLESYMAVCAAAFEGLSGEGEQLAATAVGAAFGFASGGVRYSTSVDGVEVRVSADGECSFFKD